jgi:hypothetical protein
MSRSSCTLNPTLLLIALLVVTAEACAQQDHLSAADSALVSRILLAEQRRDGADISLGMGIRHGSAQISMLARRARARITDSLFGERDSLPRHTPPTAWPEPAWKVRYRALTPRETDCSVFRAALTDSAWPVRLRAADVVPATCGSDVTLVSHLRSWIETLPSSVSRRRAGEVSWHGAAHALVALARLRAPDALTQMNRAAFHDEWHLRLYAVRAARLLSDTGGPLEPGIRNNAAMNGPLPDPDD